MLVHTLSRFPIGFNSEPHPLSSNFQNSDQEIKGEGEPLILESLFGKYLMIGSEEVIMIGLVFALAVRYIFWRNKDYYNQHIRQQYHQNHESQQNLKAIHETSNNYCRTIPVTPSQITVTNQDSDTESMIFENSKAPTDPSVSSRKDSVKGDNSDEEKTRFFIGDDFSSKIYESEFIDCEVQTYDIDISNYKTVFNEPQEIRGMKTLLEVY